MLPGTAIAGIPLSFPIWKTRDPLANLDPTDSKLKTTRTRLIKSSAERHPISAAHQTREESARHINSLTARNPKEIAEIKGRSQRWEALTRRRRGRHGPGGPGCRWLFGVNSLLCGLLGHWGYTYASCRRRWRRSRVYRAHRGHGRPWCHGPYHCSGSVR